jgi:hypothetical protein
MSQENIERLKRESSAMNWVVGLVAALVFYVVSLGPVVKVLVLTGWGTKMSSTSQKTYAVIYTPLGYACDHFKPLDQFVRWEMKLLGLYEGE